MYNLVILLEAKDNTSYSFKSEYVVKKDFDDIADLLEYLHTFLGYRNSVNFPVSFLLNYLEEMLSEKGARICSLAGSYHNFRITM